MSDRVQIILILAISIVVIIIGFIFRNTARRIKLDLTEDGIHTDLETQDAATRDPRQAGLVSIRKSRQKGRSNRIDISRGDVVIEKHRQSGTGHQLNVRTDEHSDTD